MTFTITATAAPAAAPAPGRTGLPGSGLAMFPGQGSQRPGMARHLMRQYPDTAGEVLDLAGRILGLPLRELCVSGTAEDLARTEVTQPAVVATSLATLDVLRGEGRFAPSAVAGHSLGEFTALVAADVLTPEDALRLVCRRGQLMAEVGRQVPGGMTAIIGLTAAQVETVCRRAAGHGLVEVANYNDERQTVVSGELAAVTEAARLARAAGAERTVALQVSAPFHCSLMRAIEEEFAACLRRCSFADPRIPVLSSVTGTWVRDGEEARRLLRRQLAAPVRWVEVLRTAYAAGRDAFTEVGPGRVLSGFARYVVPDATVRSTNDARRVTALLDDHDHAG